MENPTNQSENLEQQDDTEERDGADQESAFTASDDSAPKLNTEQKGKSHFFRNCFEVYHFRKDYIYYRVVLFGLMISITVLTVIFGINADVAKQHEDYRWYLPWSILKFVENQLDYDLMPRTSILSLNLDSLRSPPTDYRFLFVVDRTGSTELDSEMQKLRRQIVDSIHQEIKKDGQVNRKILDSLSLQEILCLRMVLSLYDNPQKDKYIEVGVAYYDGIAPEKRDLSDKVFDYLKLKQNNKGTVDSTSTKMLKFERAYSKEQFYLDMKDAFRLNRRKGESSKDRTDFKEIIEGINALYFDDGNQKKKTVITIFSDFHHDVNIINAEGRIDEEFATVRFDEVENALRSLASQNNITQLNLVRIPRKGASKGILDEIDHLIPMFKSKFNEAYYYRIYAPLLTNEKNINDRLEEIIAPTIKNEEGITFYYPYLNDRVSTSREARAKLQFVYPAPFKGSNCVISLHSREIYDQMENLRMSLKFQDWKRKDITYSKVLNIRSYVRNTLPDKEFVEASYYNFGFAQQFSDLSIDVFPEETNFKIRYPVVFKEKLSKINAIIAGVSAVGMILSCLLYICFAIGDSILSWIKDKNRKRKNSKPQNPGIQDQNNKTAKSTSEREQDEQVSGENKNENAGEKWQGRVAFISILFLSGGVTTWLYSAYLSKIDPWNLLPIGFLIFISTCFFWFCCNDYDEKDLRDLLRTLKQGGDNLFKFDIKFKTMFKSISDLATIEKKFTSLESKLISLEPAGNTEEAVSEIVEDLTRLKEDLKKIVNKYRNTEEPLSKVGKDVPEERRQLPKPNDGSREVEKE